MNYLLKKLNFAVAFVVATALLVLGSVGIAYAAPTSEFTQVINAGVLTADMVDGSFNSIAAPNVPLSDVTFGFTCQQSTGTFGTTSAQIYAANPAVTTGAWALTLAASSVNDLWTSAGNGSLQFDFNDEGGSPAGCADSGDADSVAGQMTIDPSGATLANGQCTGCTTTGASLGASAAFSSVVSSITIVSFSAASDDSADYTIQGVGVTQQIPQQQAVANDYAIDLVLTAA